MLYKAGQKEIPITQLTPHTSEEMEIYHPNYLRLCDLFQDVFKWISSEVYLVSYSLLLKNNLFELDEKIITKGIRNSGCISPSPPWERLPTIHTIFKHCNQYQCRIGIVTGMRNPQVSALGWPGVRVRVGFI